MGSESSDRRRYNVIAAFRDAEEARDALQMLERQGIPLTHVQVRRPGESDGDGRAEERAEMQEEVDHSIAGPSVFATESQTKGAIAGTVALTVVGVVVGAVVGLVWALAVDSGMNAWFRFIVPTVAFGIAGSTVGFVAGGALLPRLEGQADPERTYDDSRTTAERAVLVTVHSDTEGGMQQAAQVLQRFEPERLDYVHASGSPLPPQAEDLRPADPSDRWWKGPATG